MFDAESEVVKCTGARRLGGLDNTDQPIAVPRGWAHGQRAPLRREHPLLIYPIRPACLSAYSASLLISNNQWEPAARLVIFLVSIQVTAVNFHRTAASLLVYNSLISPAKIEGCSHLRRILFDARARLSSFASRQSNP